MSDRHPEEQFIQGLRMPVDFVPTSLVKTQRSSHFWWRQWGVTEVVSAVMNQGQCGSCWAFSDTQAVESQLVLTSGGFRVDLFSRSRVARLPPARTVFMVVTVAGLRVPTSS